MDRKNSSGVTNESFEDFGDENDRDKNVGATNRSDNGNANDRNSLEVAIAVKMIV